MPRIDFYDSDTITSSETIWTKTCFISSNRYVVCYMLTSTNYIYADIYQISNGSITPLLIGQTIITGAKISGSYDCYDITKVRDNMWAMIYVTSTKLRYTSCFYNEVSIDLLNGDVDTGVSANWHGPGCCTIAEDKIVACGGNIAGGITRLVCMQYNGSSWNLGSNTTAGQASYYNSMISTDTDKFLIVKQNVALSKGEITIGTVSGTTITTGSDYDISGSDNIAYSNCCKMDTDKIVICLRSSTAPDDSKAYAVTISGLIPTIGTGFIFSDPTAYPCPCSSLDDGISFVIAYADTVPPGKQGHYQICQVNWGTLAISSITGELNFYDFAVGGLADYGLDIDIDQNNRIVIAYQDDYDVNDIGKIIYGEAFAVPPPPSSITIVPGLGQNTVTFTADAEATYTHIYWSYSPGVTKATGTKISDVTSPYIHSGLAGCVPIYYVLTSESAYGEGYESSEYSGTPFCTSISISGYGGDSENIIIINDFDIYDYIDLYYSLLPNVTKENGIKISNIDNPYYHIDLTIQNYYYIAIGYKGSQETNPSNEICLRPDFQGKIFDHCDQIKYSLLYQYQDKD